MLDHICIEVSNYQVARQFYSQALAPLGYSLLMEVEGFAGFGIATTGPLATLWIRQGKNPSKIHIAFTALNRQVVRAFHEAAIKSGGKDNGKPGIREHYHPNYYGAFIFDPDGNNIEAVCHKPE
jgi:catechol 2,3-dioxygenase-like lactoylglutathione lyase family enzyme